MISHTFRFSRITAGAALACVIAVSLAGTPSTTPPTGLRENTPAVHAFTGAKLIVSPGKMIAPSRGVIKGTSAVVSTADAAGSKVVIKPQAAMHATVTVPRRRMRDGSDEETSDNYPNSPMGAYALFRQAMYDAKWYAQAWAIYYKNTNLPRPERNEALNALQAALGPDANQNPNHSEMRRIPVIIDAQDELYDLRADRVGREFDLNVIIHSTGGREYRRLDEIAKTKRPVIV